MTRLVEWNARWDLSVDGKGINEALLCQIFVASRHPNCFFIMRRQVIAGSDAWVN